MTLTVSRGEGLTVITVTPNPKSKWPVLCEILGFLCYNPVCSVSQGMQGKLKDLLTALGVLHDAIEERFLFKWFHKEPLTSEEPFCFTKEGSSDYKKIVQMCIGVLNIAVGILFTCARFYFSMYATAQGPFWLGSVFLLSGIVCILAVKFSTSSLMIIGMTMNGVNFALAFITYVVYVVDLTNGHNEYRGTCDYYSRHDYGTPSPDERRRIEICLSYKNEIIKRGLDIMMIMLVVLQLCVTISFCVLNRKVLFKDVKSVEDPELHKPLLEDATAGAAC